MGSSLMDNLGQMHLVHGKITGSDATDAALTCNDGSATLTRNAAGDYTVTFGEVFLSAPTVTGSAVFSLGTATAATDAPTVTMESVDTNAVVFNVVETCAGTTGIQLDADMYFIAVGMRNV